MIERKIISSSVSDGITIITVQNIGSKDIPVLFSAIAEKGVSVGIIYYASGDNGKLNLCFSFSDDFLGTVMSCMGKVTGKDFVYSISADNSQIVFEVEDVTSTDETLCRILEAMDDANVCIKLISASVNKIYVIVGNIDIDKALKKTNELKR